MDEVMFGQRAAQAIVAQLDRLGSSRALRMTAARSTRKPSRSAIPEQRSVPLRRLAFL
jgi:hypothetical protein